MIWRNQPQRRGGFHKGHGNDLPFAHGRQHVKLTTAGTPRGVDTETRRQHTVESGGRSAALEMAEHGDARFVSHPRLDLPGNFRADPAELLGVGAFDVERLDDLFATG